MGLKTSNEFVLNCIGSCFFCSREFPSNDEGASPTYYSIKLLSRYVRMDFRKVFIDEAQMQISPELLAQVEKSKLKVGLCEDCASLGEKFSRRYRQLEKLELEVRSSLEEVGVKLLEGVLQYSKDGCLNVLELVREEARQKCFSKLINDDNPRVRIQNLREVHGSKGSPQPTPKPDDVQSEDSQQHDVGDDYDILDPSNPNIFNLENVLMVIEEDVNAKNVMEAALISSDNGSSNVLPSTSSQAQQKSRGKRMASVAQPKSNPKKKVSVTPTPTNSRPKRNRKCPTKFSASFSVLPVLKPASGSTDDVPIKSKFTNLTTSHKSPFNCDICQKEFKFKNNLKEHIDRHHEPNRQRLYKCKTCSKDFFTSREMNQHNIVHTPDTPLRCSVCKKGFKRQHNLKLHEKIHDPHRTRSHSCSTCPKAFYTSSELRKHMITHREDRPFGCSVCNTTFKTRREVDLHSKVHLEARPYQCQFCTKNFKRGSELLLHERGHTGEGLNVCDICGKGFGRKTRLRDHLRSHEKDRDKPYQCQVCKTFFTYKRSLKNHQRLRVTCAPTT